METRQSNGSVSTHSNGSSTPQLLEQQLLLLKQQQQLKQRRATAKNHDFATSSDDILKKYSKCPPSLSLHIFETHYRFNNSQDSNTIPKNSPMIKDFLHHVLKEEIPLEMSELTKDFAIKSYDGCLILQVYDHRNMIPTGVPNPSQNAQKDDNPPQTNGTKSDKEDPKSSVPSKPKTYRTLLRPTQLSLYYDLLYHTDSALTKFTDPLSLQMESEILALTNRKLDLSVPLNPYQQEDYLRPEIEYPKKVWDEKTQDYKLQFSHRSAIEVPTRKLHHEEMVLHKSSEYEEIMFLLSNKYKRTDDSEKKLVVLGGSNTAASTGPASAIGVVSTPSKSKEGTVGPDFGKRSEVIQSSSLASNSLNTGQFMRLRFIEDIRKRKEAQKAQKDATVALQTQTSAINTINQNSSINGQSPEKNMATKPPIQNPAMVPQQSRALSNSASPPTMAAQSPSMNNQRTLPQNRSQMQQQMQLQQQQQQQQQHQQQLRMQQQRQFAQQQLSNQANAAAAAAVAQQNQLLAAQAQQIKRQKMSPQINQMQFNQAYQSPQMANSPPPPTSLATPIMGRPAPNQRMQQLQQQIPMNNQRQNRPPPQQAQQFNQMPGQQQPQQPQRGPGGANVQAQQAFRQMLQQQQQQLFQTLIPVNEQAAFKQAQNKVSALVAMGNSGVAPNKTRLTPQQQQTAVQQAKVIQQSLMQKYPAYFQRLRRLQIARQQQQQQQQQRQQQQQQQQQQLPQFNQNMMMNGQLPMNAQLPMNMQLPMYMDFNNDDDKRKGYGNR